jgi:hypothetical protein
MLGDEEFELRRTLLTTEANPQAVTPARRVRSFHEAALGPRSVNTHNDCITVLLDAIGHNDFTLMEVRRTTCGTEQDAAVCDEASIHRR